MIDLERLQRLRNECFDLIDRAIAIDPHHKSYEGAMTIHFGNRWDPNYMGIELHCYLSPGGRHHDFGSLDELEQYLQSWREELVEEEAE